MQYVAFPLGVLLVWQGSVEAGFVRSNVIPGPIQVVTIWFDLLTNWTGEAARYSGTWFDHAVASLWRVFAGFAWGVTLGVVLGLLIGLSRGWERTLDPTMQVLRNIPVTAWVPISLVFFGIGNAPAIFLIGLGAFFPAAVNTTHGVRQIDATLYKAACMMGANERELVVRVILPGALPSIMTGIRLSMGVQALASVSLEVADAEFVTIVGASGCGKSTLLNLVAGFEPLSFGKVLSDGEPINGPGPDRGVVFQQTALFPWLTVAKNIGFGLKLKANAGKAPVESTVETLLRRTGLSKFRDRFPAELSGGMRQRAAIAAVLAINPSTLLMDEPFGALDALTRSLMQDFLLELWEQDRKTVLLVTHDIDEAIYLADRTVIMTAHPGRVREVIGVDMPRPRTFEMQSDPKFIEIRDHVRDIVRQEAAKSAHDETVI